MRGIFFYTAILAFTGGIFLHSFFDVEFSAILTLLLLSGTFFLLWLRTSVLRKNTQFLSLFFLIALAFLSVSLGALRMHVEERSVSPLSGFVDREATLEGVVVREPDIRETTMHLYTEVGGTDEIVLVITDRYQDISYGDEVRVLGELQLPEAFETDLGRTFDYPGYLKARGVTYTMVFADVEHLGEDAGNPVLASLLNMKHAFTQVVEGIVPEPQVGLGEGLLLGMKRALGEELEEAFRVTGIIHIVVLSGYNVMLVAEAIMRLLSFVFAPRTRMVIGVGAITAFALLVGLSATVVRASIMASLILVARATGRTYAILRALMIAGLIMLLVNPYLLAFDPGFQLSFLATLGLIFLAPVIEKRLQLVPSKYQVREFVTATISTQIFVTPLLLYLMGSISLVAVLVNVLVLPAVPVAMLLTFATGVVGALSTTLAALLGLGAHVVLTYIIVVAESFATLSHAALEVAVFPFWLAVLLYVGIGVFLYTVYTYRRDVQSEPMPSMPADTEGSYARAGWVIETGDEKRGSSDPFPFR